MPSRLFAFTAAIALWTASPCLAQPPTISSNGIVPLYSTTNIIEPGEWISIYGNNLATGTAVWNGDYPISLGGTSVTIDRKPAYLWFVSPGQINLQVPDDSTTGSVVVAVTTPNGSVSTGVTLAPFAPAFLLLDSKHVSGIILRSNGSGTYGGGTYDILGPTGNSLGYPTVAAKPGDNVVLFCVGFGPTTPSVPAGQAYSGAAPINTAVNLYINSTLVKPSFVGISGSGLYQFNLTLPSGLGTGDVSLSAGNGAVTQSGVVISLQNASTAPQIQSVTLSSGSVTGGSSTTGTVALTATAPAGGAVVALSSSSGAVSVPATVTVPSGAASATFTISTVAVPSTQTVTVTATYGGASALASLLVTAPAVVNQSLTITTSGSGGGAVASSPAGTSCGSGCLSFPTGTIVALTATPKAGSTFAGWSGSCSGNGACSVTMNASQSVNAVFNLSVNPTLTISTSGTGGGTVAASPSGTSCGSGCLSFPAGTAVALTATPNTGSTFAGWSGACSGTGGCSLTMNANQTVTAAFNLAAPQLQSVTLSSSSISGGNSVTGTVTLSSAAPGGGALVTLSSSSTVASVPASLTVPANSVSATFSVTTLTVTATQSATITASYGGISKQASLSVIAPAGVAITSISNTSPLPFSPLTIVVSGISSSSPANVTFTNNAGYTFTTASVTVSATGSLMVGTPIYVTTTSGQIGPGVLFVTVSQGSKVTAPVSVNIQDIPPLSAYGVSPGAISHAVLVFDIMMIGQRLNQLQAFQALPANKIDTSAAQASLNTLLNAVIQERSDVDNVTLNSSLVVSGGTLPNGTQMQFDHNSLDMMDRIHALFLTQTLGTIQSSLGAERNGALPASHAKLLARHAKRPKDPLTGLPSTRIQPLPFGFHPQKSAGERRAATGTDQPDVLSASTIETLLNTMENFNGTYDLVTGSQKSQSTNCQDPSSQGCWMGLAQANAQVMAGTVGILNSVSAIPGSADLEAKMIGGAAAVLQDGQVVADVFAQLTAFTVGEATGNQALVDVAVQAMDENQSKALGALTDLSIALLGGPSFSEAAQGASTVLAFANNFIELGEQAMESANETSGELAAEVQPLSNVSVEFGTLYGTADITNTEGIAAAQTGLDLSGGFIDLTTVADPAGDYQILVPLNVPGFDYLSADLEAFDPVDEEYISDETVNISALTSSYSVTLPVISGECDDSDAGDPDSDDPDCD